MSSLVAISSKDLVSNGFNNQYRYSFPASANFKNVEVAVQSISMYNSQFNVDSVAYANNTFKIEMPTAATVSTISITLKDGIYSYTDINRMIQTALVNAGAYLVDPNGDNVFWIQLVENATYYAAQVDVSSVPTAIGTYTRPATGLYSATGTGLPTTGRVPRLIVDNAAFGKLIGFSAGQYPSASSTVAASFLSDLAPEVWRSRIQEIGAKGDRLIDGSRLRRGSTRLADRAPYLVLAVATEDTTGTTRRRECVPKRCHASRPKIQEMQLSSGLGYIPIQI